VQEMSTAFASHRRCRGGRSETATSPDCYAAHAASTPRNHPPSKRKEITRAPAWRHWKPSGTSRRRPLARGACPSTQSPPDAPQLRLVQLDQVHSGRFFISSVWKVHACFFFATMRSAPAPDAGLGGIRAQSPGRFSVEIRPPQWRRRRSRKLRVWLQRAPSHAGGMKGPRNSAGWSCKRVGGFEVF